MTWIDIQPRDVWLFRDGKPFNAGENNRASSMFPPTPLTLQGALRRKISESHGVSYREYTSDDKKQHVKEVDQFIGSYQKQKSQGLSVGDFKMRGPFVSIRTQDGVLPLFRCPADFLVNEDKDTRTFDSFITAPSHNLTSDLGGNYRFLEVRREYENLSSHWITGDAFADYCRGKTPSSAQFVSTHTDVKDTNVALKQDKKILPNRFVYSLEGRFGVSTDSATSFREEGQLYQAQFVRPKPNIGLLVKVDGSHDSKYLDGTMILGGEQRQAQNKPVAKLLSFPKLPDVVDGHFKIIFLTPAYFAQGWLPAGEDWSRWFGADVKLISAALYRPQRIGGWSSAKGGQRAMHNYVAPGSVYYFEGKPSKKLLPAITENPPHITDATAIGFGQVAYSNWS